ncbi:NADPH-dependent FMN reductase [Limoniibacter endophyticus]|uniref:FMN reductase n=1 Tax=Limoniibacter endophyticus TaxID=1565040 RepID=A0A8J3GHL6_9HYPH|nr:NAD(P)H-dependent oxidoreductase [Limoniibacter endophyticus]GHC66985.1 FMN reductase [Limoniibacter endophyticus]
MSVRILVFAGSLRTGAYSGLTADAAQAALAAEGAEVTRISLADYVLPIMDQDLEAEEGLPRAAIALARQFAGHDGFLIASPEYNGSMPPLLKNAIDWVSRVEGHDPKIKPFDDKVAALCSSSPGKLGGMRGLVHLRAVLNACNVEVIARQCSISRASQAFDADGTLREEADRKAIRLVARRLVDYAAAIAGRREP